MDRAIPGPRSGTWGTQIVCCEGISGALGAGDAGDGLQVWNELDLVETGGCEEPGDGFGLAVADFKGNEAAGDETREGLRDETAVDVEAVRAGEEG